MITKEIILQTQSTWDEKKYNPINIKNPEVTLLKITIPPKSKLPMHKHIMLNIAYVTKGTLTVTTEDNKEKIIHAGQGLAEVVDDFHYGRNDGEESVEMVVFYIGEKGTELSENK